MEISFSTCEERIITINLPHHIKNFDNVIKSGVIM